ncbi:uncharacterized protein FOMMEDRAFT_146300 [Fomitiporia mediterranea MF3/22]|uniref:uncharacterized protein n=1 Tax=Fomitiporia mediterranea (strain MF3/22) TaxID=694068 RepID=UPI000440885E|nr:uncharacterized protein FOMMEDRAFT_146300 [Fomitiporia mediterranea MF3/22]EJD04336.1 hypothetical protein FOMMEDRAFT_146300 [Fomitiporia mediterranea MF3/22]
MARTTRSSASHAEKTEDENEHPGSLSPPTSTKAKAAAVAKKRKRLGTDSDDLPAAKQVKANDEDTLDRDEEEHVEDAGFPPLSGDLPMNDEDAQKILEILEMADTQALLDRVFPLDDVLSPNPSSIPSSSKTPSDSYSLRTLLKEAKDHPLRIFRSAIKHLYPISSQPRARISPPAAQQLRFCQLALTLIEQASRNNIDGLSLKPELILPEKSTKEEDEMDVINTRRKYALVQRLPTGDLWTSLSTDLPGSDAKPLAELSTGHAELVSILPSSSSSKPIPTLGELHADKNIQSKYKPPTTRHVSCGAFLDYGPYASFAPSFDSDGGDVGRAGVSKVLWRRHEKGKAREKARILGDRYRAKLAAQAAESMGVDEVTEVELTEGRAAELRREAEKRKDLLEKLFSQEEAEPLQKILDALDCEENVSELLLHNAKALLRLQELQKERLRGENESARRVKVGSEEWNLAHAIMDSLTLLTSMRPRKPNGEVSAVIPPASVLHVLQQTLPAEASQGWYGTLSESRGFAVRDDTTVRMKGPLEVPAAEPAPATTPAAPVTQTHTSTYPTNYSYAGYSQHYRTPYTTQTQGGQTGSYFTGTAAQGIGTPQAQKTQTPYTSQYGGTTQYTYGSWFPTQSTAGSGAGTPTPSSRKGTPQPSTITSGAFTNSTYLPYSSALAAASSATPVRAVANTVTGKSQPNGWTLPNVGTPGAGGARVGTTPTGTSGFTLPAHLRPGGLTTPMSPLASGSTFGLSATPNYGVASTAGYQATPPANT